MKGQENTPEKEPNQLKARNESVEIVKSNRYLTSQ